MADAVAVATVAAALLAASLFCVSASAAPLEEPHPGGVGFVGPTSAHVTSIFWNPAALSQLSGAKHLFVGGTARIDRTTVEREPIATATGEPDPAGDLAFDPVTTTALSPGGFVGGVYGFGTERYRIGFAAYTPYAERLAADDRLAYHERGGSVYALFNTLTLAIRVNSDFSLAGGLTFVFPRVDLRFDRDRALEDPASCPQPTFRVEDPRCAEELTFESDDISPALSFNVGILLRVPRMPRLTVGIAYLSPPTSFGRDDITLPGETQAVGFADNGVHAYRLRGEGRLSLRLPQTIHAGLRYRLTSEIDLLFHFRWLDMSAHRLYDLRLGGPALSEVGVPEWILRYRGFRDVYALEAGLEVEVLPELHVAALFRGETSAVDEELVAPHQVDGPRGEVGLGAAFLLTQEIKLALGYALGAIAPRDVEDSAFSPSAFTRCRESGFHLDQCEDVRLGRATPTAAGAYTRMTHEWTVGVSFQF